MWTRQKERTRSVKRRLSILLLMTCLAACATDPFEIGKPGICPHNRNYTNTQLDQLDRELTALPAGSMLRVAIADYLNLRDQVRACRGNK